MKLAAAMVRHCIAVALLVAQASAAGCPADDASQKWVLAHNALGSSRVNQDMFLSLPLRSNYRGEEPLMFRAYLSAVFDAARALAYPTIQDDLGLHDFSYAVILANEFYSESGEFADKLGLTTGSNAAKLDVDWKKVKKDGEGRVNETEFKNFYSKKNLGRLITIEAKKSYGTFLEKTFFAARMMMFQLPGKFAKGTLDSHGFQYAGLMAGEFYSGGKAPDVLGITNPGGSKSKMMFLQAKSDPAVSAWVSSMWSAVHKDLVADRVDRQMFLSAFATSNALFTVYLNAIFDAATATMLPKVRKDLGKHSFGYAAVLSSEFFPESGKPADKLGFVSGTPQVGCASFAWKNTKMSLDEDFAKVAKDGKGRVTLQAFQVYYMKKFERRLTAGNLVSYRSFLSKVFFAGRASMMNFPAKFRKGTLGGHSFRYAGLMAGEFYFASYATDILGIHY